MKPSSLFSWAFRPNNSTPKPATSPSVEEDLGVTDELKDFVKSFTVQTFKDFPLPQRDDGNAEVSGQPKLSNVRKDLTDWQERHATLVLTTIKEISHLRYVLCPRHLKDNQFWRIYFSLIRTYTAPYEIRAIQKEKIRRMESMHNRPVEKPAFEVEMTDAKQLAGGSSYDLENGS